MQPKRWDIYTDRIILKQHNIMGLKIANYVAKGVTYVDAYAKIGNFNYDNNSKVASNVTVDVYSTKSDDKRAQRMLHVETIPCGYVANVTGDITAACYAKVNKQITDTKARIAQAEAVIANPTSTPFEVGRATVELDRMYASPVLQLDGATEWQ
jgi:hypothetical protein